MTFIWPRLTWPALAWHHVAPWSRKIAATSSNGWDMAAMRSAGLCCHSLWLSLALFGFLGLLTRLRQPVKRALDAGDQAGCDPRVARRRIQFVVTQQCLDDSDISVVFEQVGREAVPQRMQRYVLLDPGCVGCLVEHG